MIILLETEKRRHYVQWSDREHPRLSTVTFSICADYWRGNETGEMALGVAVNEVTNKTESRRLVCWHRAPHRVVTAMRTVELLKRLESIDEAILAASYDVMRRERDGSSYKSLSLLRTAYGNIATYRQDIIDQPISDSMITSILREGCWWDDHNPNALHACIWELLSEQSLGKLKENRHVSVLANNQLSYYRELATNIDLLPAKESFERYCHHFGIDPIGNNDLLRGNATSLKTIDETIVKRGQILDCDDDRSVSVMFYCGQKSTVDKSLFHVGFPVVSVRHESITTSWEYSIGAVFYRDYHTWVQLSPIDWGNKDYGMPIIIRLSDLFDKTTAFIGISCEARDHVTIEDQERGYVPLTKPRRRSWFNRRQGKEVHS
ncbi:MAG: hypothetical protein Q4C83_03265 [Candidatus Saccharibacteria bacterium]|nr:hypothetical protein [Candidatus Saccharibacteria bacterium]